MIRFYRNLILILSIFVLTALSCDVFTPEYQEKLRQEATETTQAEQSSSEEQPNVVPFATVKPADTEQSLPADQICSWVQLEPTDALATGSGTPGMSAQREGDWIGTSYTHAGNFGCSEQTLVTTHTWDGLYEELKPGLQYTLLVYLTWRLEGTPECTSLTAGAKTSLTVGTNTIEVARGTINLSSEPDGDLSVYDYWTAPRATNEGDTLKISTHGSSGSLGGTVFYTYEYICRSS
jgi:hypothetical protein